MAPLVVLGFTDPQLGAKPTAPPTLSRRGRHFSSQRKRVVNADKKQLSAKLSGTSRIPWWAGCRTLTSTGLGISLVCPTTNDAPRACWESAEKSLANQGWRTFAQTLVAKTSPRTGSFALAIVRPWEHAAFTMCGVRNVQSWHKKSLRKFSHCNMQNTTIVGTPALSIGPTKTK